MKKYFLILFFVIISKQLIAIEISADLFQFDEQKIEQEFKELNELEDYLQLHPDYCQSELIEKFPTAKNILNHLNNNMFDNLGLNAPGKLSSFWFSFAMGAVGTYFIYGAVAGPIAVTIVYFSTKRDKTETKKALWGCTAGTLVGAGIKYAVVTWM